MTEPLVTVSVTETSDPASEVARLRMLLKQAEVHAGCRFAMISFHETPNHPPTLVVTTSADDPTPLERHLLAAVAPAAGADHVRAVRGEQSSDRLADAARGAADDGGAAGKIEQGCAHR